LRWRASPRVAQEAALTGTVTDAAGAKLKNAKVILLGAGLVFTDANGIWFRHDFTGSGCGRG